MSWLIEYADEPALRAAATAARDADFSILEVYSPHELEPPVFSRSSDERDARRIARDGVIAGLSIFAIVYALQWWSKDFAYPFPVGGRGPHPWPAFILPAIEFMMLWMGVAGLVSFLFRTQLPSLSNPLFAADGFERATQTHFFLELDIDENGLAAFCGQTDALDRTERPN